MGKAFLNLVLMVSLVVIFLCALPSASASNICLCGTCTTMDGYPGPDECSNPGGGCTVPSCGSASSCTVSCSNIFRCVSDPEGGCPIPSVSMWYYGPINRCYTFSSSTAGNQVCNFTIQTSCYSLESGQQLNEKVLVKVNGVTIGTTPDPYCNNPAPPACVEDGPVLTTFNNVVLPVRQGSNDLTLEAVHDSVSIELVTMKCKPQTSGPICGDGIVTPPEQCEYNSQCNDGNPQTTDTCVQCQCTHTTNPYCGDGIVTPPEECEFDSQCNDGNPNTLDTCQNCQCYHENTNFCGDGTVNGNEQCEPPTGNNNQYCGQSTTTCSGTKTGVRDAYGYCSLTCGCIEDNFAFACLIGSCGAECGNNADCADGDPLTRDVCQNDCSCIHESIPYCGNNQLDPGEQCESNIDCPVGKVCQECRCINGPYCGDHNVDPDESCDFGININGIPCVPRFNSTCTYCNSTCGWTTLAGGGCGNLVIEYGEECDEGVNNGVLCSATRCDNYCIYCRDNCRIGYVNGPACDDNHTIPEPPGPPGPPIPPPYPCAGLYCPPVGGGGPRAGICGDGVISIGEDCDYGYDNGMACSPACNSDCQYCNSDCKKVVIDGSPCARTPRPWDPIVTNPCRTRVYPVGFARLDSTCGAGSKVVTAEVNASENRRARQGACSMNASNIYLTWFNVDYTRGLRNISLFLEHFEENADIRIEYFNGSQWLYQCDVKRTDRDTLDSCAIKGVSKFDNVTLRVKVLRAGAGAYENLDYAYLSADYCTGPTTCGNGIVDAGENCDDGNLMTGDGCDEFCGREYLLCGEWGECIDGKQAQVCYYGNMIRTNTRRCGSLFFTENFMVIILVFLLILLVLLLLFFPVIYYAITNKKDEKEKKRGKQQF